MTTGKRRKQTGSSTTVFNIYAQYWVQFLNVISLLGLWTSVLKPMERIIGRLGQEFSSYHLARKPTMI